MEFVDFLPNHLEITMNLLYKHGRMPEQQIISCSQLTTYHLPIQPTLTFSLEDMKLSTQPMTLPLLGLISQALDFGQSTLQPCFMENQMRLWAPQENLFSTQELQQPISLIRSLKVFLKPMGNYAKNQMVSSCAHALELRTSKTFILDSGKTTEMFEPLKFDMTTMFFLKMENV